MNKIHLYLLLALMLVVSCECKDMHIRRMPDEKDIVFEGEAKTAKKTVSTYRKGQSRDIQVHLTSNNEEAQDAQFKILSATLADGSPADLDYDSLKIGKNTLSYTPKGPGTHALAIKVAVEGEEESAQTIHYTLEAPAANWQVSGTADATGNIALTITDAPEEWRSESWRITSTRWSRGLQGRITGNITRLQAGENTLPITLLASSLAEPPQVHFTLQGPDSTSQSITLDLRAMCVARLEETYSQARIQVLSTHNETVRDQATNYQGNVAGNTRVEAQRTLNALYETTTRLQRDTNEQLERLQSNISILLLQYSADLTVLNNRSVALRHALEKLNESMRILQPMLDQLNASNTGPIDPYHVLLEALAQGTYDEASMAPHLTSPLLSDVLLNKRDPSGHTLLHYATEAENQEAIALLLRKGAVQDLPPEWQLQGRYDTPSQQLTLTISDAPERSRAAQWRIANVEWSGGTGGNMPNVSLQYGENAISLPVAIITLTAPPSLRVLVQGPDNAYQAITIDLTALCIAQVQANEMALTAQTERVTEYVQRTDAAYQLPPETVTDPRVNRDKQAEIATLLRRLTAFKTQYQRDIQTFEHSLETLEQAEVSENLPVFKTNNTSLEKAIASLKSAEVQLQQQCTSAHTALFKMIENEEQEAIETLLEDPELDVNGRDEQENTLLHMTVITENIDVVRKLIALGVEVNAQNKIRETALHWAAFFNKCAILEVLIEKTAEIDAGASHENGYMLSAYPVGHVFKSLFTALHGAAMYGSGEAVEILLENGANINSRDGDGWTALHHAAYNCHESVVQTLLNKTSVDVNTKNVQGDTALELASSSFEGIIRPEERSRIIALLKQSVAR